MQPQLPVSPRGLNPQAKRATNSHTGFSLKIEGDQSNTKRATLSPRTLEQSRESYSNDSVSQPTSPRGSGLGNSQQLGKSSTKGTPEPSPRTPTATSACMGMMFFFYFHRIISLFG
jgi:hypothetical protein